MTMGAVHRKAPTISETYTYDGTGLRASQTVSGATSYLTWDQSGGLPLLLNDGSTSYIYGPGGLPIEQISGETPTYYHHDQLGSTRLLTNSSGAATGAFSYSAYGSLSGRTGTQTTPLGFAGQYTSAESGLIYLRARVYDPGTGHFLTRDPLEALTGSPYNYVYDNPMNGADPTGLWLGLPIPSPGEVIEDLNPIKYYEEEINAIENGCSYWDAVSHGLQGAAVAASDVTGAAAIGRAALGGEAANLAEGAANAAASTGRTEAATLAEQLAMREAMSDPAAGTEISSITMSDPRWPASEGWVKMTQSVNGVEIHYVYNIRTGAAADFKFK